MYLRVTPWVQHYAYAYAYAYMHMLQEHKFYRNVKASVTSKLKWCGQFEQLCPPPNALHAIFQQSFSTVSAAVATAVPAVGPEMADRSQLGAAH